MSTITVDEATAALQEAQQEAAKHAAKLREAEQRAQAAQDALEADRQARYRAWCERTLAGANQARQTARERVTAERRAFAAAVMDGDLSEALRRYLAWSEAAAAQDALATKEQHAVSQITPGRVVPTPSERQQPSAFVDELTRAIEAARANRNEDVRDAVQAEIHAAIRGEA